jgi:hypothetical protein
MNSRLRAAQQRDEPDEFRDGSTPRPSQLIQGWSQVNDATFRP